MLNWKLDIYWTEYFYIYTVQYIYIELKDGYIFFYMVTMNFAVLVWISMGTKSDKIFKWFSVVAEKCHSAVNPNFVSVLSISNRCVWKPKV